MLLATARGIAPSDERKAAAGLENGAENREIGEREEGQPLMCRRLSLIIAAIVLLGIMVWLLLTDPGAAPQFGHWQ